MAKKSKAAEADEMETSWSVNGVAVDAAGKLVMGVTASDGESFNSFVHRIDDIAADMDDVDDVENEHNDNYLITCLAQDGNGAIWLGDDDGNVRTNVSGKWKKEVVAKDASIGAVRCLDDKSTVAITANGQLYVRDAKWVALGKPAGAGVKSLAGNQRNMLVAVGDAGLAMQFDGSSWVSVGAPCKVNVHDALMHRDQLWLCGANGTILCRDAGKWSDCSDGKEDFYEFAVSGKDIWLACGSRGAGRLANKKLKIMRATFAAFNISAAGEFIAFCGNDTVVRFDGKDWEGYGYGDR